ncbi:hypothetical protein [Candidatus Albibeggiatoa sp. nov. BB20]|uniref:hypothetical protein n=1 Tax=Candidatus Albibeggiatoa sp. nov. BB20 TaxID=3162723 RepID=UPI0033654AE3
MSVELLLNVSDCTEFEQDLQQALLRELNDGDIAESVTLVKIDGVVQKGICLKQ